MGVRDDIIRQVAATEADRICRKVIRGLQAIKDRLSGDDSGLANAWDEICVQVQDQQSFFWDAYESIMYTAIQREVDRLPGHLQQALWLQTQPGVEWACDTEGEDALPYFVPDVVHYIAQEHVLREAADASNARIRTYLARQHEWDGWQPVSGPGPDLGRA